MKISFIQDITIKAHPRTIELLLRRTFREVVRDDVRFGCSWARDVNCFAAFVLSIAKLLLG